MEIKELSKTLVNVLSTLKLEIKTKKFNVVGDAFINGQIQTLEQILVSITREDDMVKLQNELVSQIVRLDDIAMRRRSSELESSIKEIVENLRPGEAALMDSEKIHYGHLSTKISQMKKAKSLETNVHVVKRGDKTYLLKK